MIYIIGWNWSFMFIVSTNLLYEFKLTGLALLELSEATADRICIIDYFLLYVYICNFKWRGLICIDATTNNDLVFLFQVVGSMIFNKNLLAINLIVGMIMYFTYLQLFLILLFRAINSISRLRGKTISWKKTTKRYIEEHVQ